jgi:hypothetical protein
MSPELDAQVLAATRTVDEVMNRALPWVAALIGALVLLAVGLAYYRSRRRRHQQRMDAPWTLQQLREMHASGDITDQEYQQLRARLLGLDRPSAGTDRGPGDVGAGNDRGQ